MVRRGNDGDGIAGRGKPAPTITAAATASVQSGVAAFRGPLGAVGGEALRGFDRTQRSSTITTGRR
jgi:hypothetical protein